MVETRWLIAVSLNICGSIAINFGTNLIKYSHLKAEQKYIDALPEAEAKAVDSNAIKKSVSGSGSSLWWSGVIIFSTGNVLNFVSFSFGPQSQLAALGSVQFVTNVFFAHFVLKMEITRRIVIATLVIVFGNTLIMVFSSQESGEFTTDDLLDLYEATAYQIYLVTMGAMVVLLQTCYYSLRKQQNHFLTMQTRISNPTPLRPFVQRLVPICYALVSGIIGTQSVVLAKSTSEILSVTIQGDNQLDNPITYVLLVAWLCTMVFWLRRLDMALQRFDAIFIIPVLQVIWIILSIVSGGIYFQEFTDLNEFDAIMFTLGALLIVVGVFMLAPRDEESGEPTGTLDVVTEDRPSRSTKTDAMRANSRSFVLETGMMSAVSERYILRAPPPSSSKSQVHQINRGSEMWSLPTPSMKNQRMQSI